MRTITDGSGSVVQTYETDEFGVPTQTQGSSTNPFQYTGEQRDAESGFAYLRARVYDPQIGRFLQRDPFGGSASNPLSLHRFAYVRNNPVNLIDPGGLSPSQNAIVGDLCFKYDTESGQLWVNPLCARTVPSARIVPNPSPRLPTIGGPVYAGPEPPALPEPDYRNPWAPGWPIISVITNAPIVLYRYVGEGSRQFGSWLTTLRPMSAARVRDILALPSLPTHYQEVVVPAGTRIQIGVANGIPGWGSGGGIQVQLLERISHLAYGDKIPLPR